MKGLFSTEGMGLKKTDRGPTVLPSAGEGRSYHQRPAWWVKGREPVGTVS